MGEAVLTDPVAIAERKKVIGWDAACEIEALIGMLDRESRNQDSSFDFVLRSTLRRIDELNIAILSAVAHGTDDGYSCEEMERMVYGRAGRIEQPA